jgi:hypothetical protein
VVVRQGGNVLSRGVNFRVTGTMAQAPAIPGSSQVARTLVEEENVEVTLPEVEPVHVSAAARIPEELQRKLWQDAAADAMSYASRLPNFRCQRETRRLASPVRNAGQFKELDSIVEELTYESGKESYRTREVNGLKSNTNRERLQGVQSRGEFGSMLKAIFRPEVPAGYRWGGRAMAGGTLCAVFEIDVPAAKSAFVLTYNTRQAVAAYQGRVFIDEETGLVRRIDMHGADLPKDFGFQSPVLSLEYGMVRIGDRDHLVPLRSVMQVREGRRLVRNETMFRAYRRFEADSRVVFQ